MLGMNSDEIQSAVTKIVISILTWVAARYLPPDLSASLTAFLPTIAAGLGALAAFAFAVYTHWNMKKVPETAKVTLQP